MAKDITKWNPSKCPNCDSNDYETTDSPDLGGDQEAYIPTHCSACDGSFTETYTCSSVSDDEGKIIYERKDI